MAAPAYSKEEISALRGIFALYDPDGTGEISSADLESLLQKIGLKQEAARELIERFERDVSIDLAGDLIKSVPGLFLFHHVTYLAVDRFSRSFVKPAYFLLDFAGLVMSFKLDRFDPILFQG